jgi:hypothetical protein
MTMVIGFHYKAHKGAMRRDYNNNIELFKICTTNERESILVNSLSSSMLVNSLSSMLVNSYC